MARVIEGSRNNKRIESRILDEEIRDAIHQGFVDLHVTANGQHGIGGRLWGFREPVKITVEGPVGQRLGGMGISGTHIVVKGNTSDDVGWLNCGAEITVLGDVGNGAHNAAAQGKLYVQGSGGARCDTMTKHNPKYEPPQSWYFRDVGDAFAEFKAGGIAVVCGVDPRNTHNVIGYRPCVGMVGGVVYFRGPIEGYSVSDVKLLELSPQDWQWLKTNIKPFLKAIEREEYYRELTKDPAQWRKFVPYTAREREKSRPMGITLGRFRKEVWEAGTGKGGIFAEYLDHSGTVLPYVTTGQDRRMRPVWSNGKYAPPCEYACPSGIPTWQRTRLIREGRLKDALELVLKYSPFPATVCGEICAHLCMQGCTRAIIDRPLDTQQLGRASLELALPGRRNPTGKNVAVIGAGAGGLSAAWQLSLQGHGVDIYEAEEKIGGKLEYFIPKDRLPQRVLRTELERFSRMGIRIHTGMKVDRVKFDGIYKEHDAVVVACGAHKPRIPAMKGAGDMVPAYDFLRDVNTGGPPNLKDKKVVVIGAGNVGMDVAAEAFRLGASDVTAVDVQKPAAFGKELEIARSLGTKVLWPRFVSSYSVKKGKVTFTDRSSLDADYVVIAIGDTPLTGFLPEGVHVSKDGWIDADDAGHTSDPRVFAVGDAVVPGLVTHAIGHGRKAAEAIDAFLTGRPFFRAEQRPVISFEQIKTVYYETCKAGPSTINAEADRCLSCGVCRDCHMCEAVCHYGAISRTDLPDGTYEYVVNDDLCIGCGMCAGVCPCGIWEMEENK